jgi:hypothetical protein
VTGTDLRVDSGAVGRYWAWNPSETEEEAMTTLRDRYIDDDTRNALFRVQRQAFLDPEVLASERARIFDRSWLYLGHESEVAEPGDFRMRELGVRRVVFVRGKDRVVRALLNSCTHRGAEVCRERSGNAKASSASTTAGPSGTTAG